ncbi:hypothetical protein GH714_030095 [Hevea brasiliensis]|uniref:Uncharacterized protein n=1 Tax=Hevea brasiliensis TaxID=3981 RepID=A0A6A6LFE3_HEVBR|nr:hypothetical protein GH714_030095 [Hevea brasiliensis]
MLSETNQEQSLSRWIAGDVDESFGLRQLLQGGNNPPDFDGNGVGALGIVDQGPGFEGICGIAGGFPSIGTNLSPFPASGFPSTNNNSNGNGKVGSGLVTSPSSSAGLVNYRGVGLGSNNNSNCSIQNPVFGSPASSVPLPATLPTGMLYHHNLQHQIGAQEEKPLVLNPQMLMNQQYPHNPHCQNPNFFLPLSFPQQENHLLQPQQKRHNSGGIDPISQMIPKLQFNDPGHEILLRKQQQQHQQHPGFPQGMQFLHPHLQQKPLVVKKEEVAAQHQQQQHQNALLDQLYKAAELVGTGNFSHAQGILARLNQQLSPIGKPLHRAAFYFKEALQLLLHE